MNSWTIRSAVAAACTDRGHGRSAHLRPGRFVTRTRSSVVRLGSSWGYRPRDRPARWAQLPPAETGGYLVHSRLVRHAAKRRPWTRTAASWPCRSSRTCSAPDSCTEPESPRRRLVRPLNHPTLLGHHPLVRGCGRGWSPKQWAANTFRIGGSCVRNGCYWDVAIRRILSLLLSLRNRPQPRISPSGHLAPERRHVVAYQGTPSRSPIDLMIALGPAQSVT
jgi:hypothetical protein